MRKTGLNLLNTMDKLQRHGGFIINTMVILLRKTVIVSFQYLLATNSMAWRVLKSVAPARFRALQAVIRLYLVAKVRRKSLDTVGSLERRSNRLGIASDLKGCMLDILKT
jgi:hypothetical protein